MSINRNRAKNKFAYNNKEYKILEYFGDPYWDEGYHYYPKYKSGRKNSNKRILSYQRRMYKSWKHNRLTQYKT